jgi:uncharacterized protein YndB with AHSA1/START domain
MATDLIAKASEVIEAPVQNVWEALVDPEAIKEYMFGSTVTSDWRKGSPISWKGEWQGKAYEDKGVILEIEPGRTLKYSHFSPLSGQSDEPENYHNVTIELVEEDHATRVSLSQDNNPDEEAREHSAKNWETMLTGLKKYVEGQTA